MAEVRRIYRVGSSDPEELNRVLADMADRLDQMEGFRDTPHFRSAPNMGGNKATNAARGVAGSDVAITEQAQAWPVGSIFVSVVSTDPASFLGYGTWAAFGTGRVLVGIDASDTDFDTVRETGGAKTHTHSTPAHQHPDGEIVDKNLDLTTVAVNDGNGGGGTTGSGSSLPPFITCYFWERTA